MEKRHYNVWICLEEYDPERDQYDDLDLRFAATGVFETENEALAFATRLHELGTSLHTRKPEED